MATELVIVRLNAVLFLAYGLGFVFLPEAMSRLVNGSAPTAVSALIDMRATYGGLSVAVGGLLFLLASNRGVVRQGLAGVVLLMAGMAGGRLYGIVVDGAPNTVMYWYLAFEVAMALIALWALMRARSSG